MLLDTQRIGAQLVGSPVFREAVGQRQGLNPTRNAAIAEKPAPCVQYMYLVKGKNWGKWVLNDEARNGFISTRNVKLVQVDQKYCSVFRGRVRG